MTLFAGIENLINEHRFALEIFDKAGGAKGWLLILDTAADLRSNK
jgi:hypothetical protein